MIARLKRIGAQHNARCALRKHVGEITLLVGIDLSPNFREKTACGRTPSLCGSLKQCHGTLGWDQKTDLLAFCSDVDSYDAAGMSQCRTAAHARIERTGKMHFRIKRVLQESVVSAP